MKHGRSLNEAEKRDILKCVYRELLGRKPDKKGLDYYLDYWDSMIFDEEGLRKEIMLSNEFKSRQILRQEFSASLSSLF